MMNEGNEGERFAQDFITWLQGCKDSLDLPQAVKNG